MLIEKTVKPTPKKTEEDAPPLKLKRKKSSKLLSGLGSKRI